MVQISLCYYDEAFAFAQVLVTNSRGQHGSILLYFLLGLADHAARNQIPVKL